MPVSDALTEQELFPYAPSLFAEKRAAVLAPHADDEVFGCGAAIASLRAAGAEVAVAIVTDGAGEISDPRERERISSLRLAESRAALAALGGATLECFSLRDRGLLAADGELRRRIARFLKERRPELLFVPAPCEVHPDHRAVARALIGLVVDGEAPGDPRLAFYEVSQAIRPNFLLDATPHLAAFEAAVAAFPSQVAGHDYPRFVRGLMAFRSMTLGPGIGSAQAFFVVTAAELRERGKEPFLRAIGPSETWGVPGR